MKRVFIFNVIETRCQFQIRPDVNKDNKPQNESSHLTELELGSTIKLISTLVAKPNHQTMLNKAANRNISTQCHTHARNRTPTAWMKFGYLNH